MADGVSSSSSGDGSDWEEWEGEEEVGCCCLFCSVIVNGGAHLLLEHCSQEHFFDLNDYINKLSEWKLELTFVISHNLIKVDFNSGG